MFAAGAPGLGGPQLKTKKGLLLIDLQNDFVDPAGKLFVPNTTEFLPKLPHLIRQFRSKGDVFFITTAYAEPRSIYSDSTGGYGLVLKSNVTSRQPSVLTEDPDDGSKQITSTPPAEASHIITGGILNKDVEAFLTPPYNSQASWLQCCVPGSNGALMPTILSSVIDPTTDTEVVKSHYSPFQDASFLLQLRMQLVTELYVCGSLSNISVYSTVIDAVSHGMSVTIIEDCVGYRDERCHREAMRQMADSLGANGIDCQELLDDFAGLLGDIVHDEDFKTHYDVAFQSGLRRKDKPDPKQKTSAWLSSLEESAPEASTARTSFDEALMRSNLPAVEASRSARQNTEPLSDLGPHRQQTPESPPRKRQFDDQEADARGLKMRTSRRASHEGHIGESSLVQPKKARRRRPQLQQRRRSPTPQQEVRPHMESQSTGDIPRAAAVESMVDSPTLKTNIRKGSKSKDVPARENVTPSPRQEKSTRRSARPKKVMSPETLGPGDTIAADSLIIFDVLPENMSKTIFDNLSTEVEFQKMYHRSGEVPRLVAVQGESSSTKFPIYRHPADSSPPLLPFTPHVEIIRRAAEDLVGHPLNHVLIQLYRTPEDNISEHSDKTLDIVRGSKIVNYSAGALRTMILRSKKSAMSTLDIDVEQSGSALTDNMSPGPPRAALRVSMPHNSLFVLGPETNKSHLHAIRADKRPSSLRSEEEQAHCGSRISLTFRHIGTFINPESGTIWGQGATSKTDDRAKKLVAGVDAEKDYEAMIRAFGQENHRSDSWDWDEHYGRGFDVVDGPNVTNEKDPADAALSPTDDRSGSAAAKRTKPMTLGPGLKTSEFTSIGYYK